MNLENITTFNRISPLKFLISPLILQKINAHVLQKVDWIWFKFNIKLGRSGAVEEQVVDMQEVRGSIQCKDGNL